MFSNVLFALLYVDPLFRFVSPQRKLAAMTPDEKVTYFAEQNNLLRREERKNRMLHSHLAGYSGAKPLPGLSRRGSSVTKTIAGGRTANGTGAVQQQSAKKS